MDTDWCTVCDKRAQEESLYCSEACRQFEWGRVPTQQNVLAPKQMTERSVSAPLIKMISRKAGQGQTLMKRASSTRSAMSSESQPPPFWGCSPEAIERAQRWRNMATRMIQSRPVPNKHQHAKEMQRQPLFNLHGLNLSRPPFAWHHRVMEDVHR